MPVLQFAAGIFVCFYLVLRLFSFVFLFCLASLSFLSHLNYLYRRKSLRSPEIVVSEDEEIANG
jgi:hypothetical protein